MYSEIAANKRKTVFLMLFFFVFVGIVAYFGGLYLGDFTVTIGALIGSTIYLVFQYFVASKAALAINGANEIAKQDNPRLWRTVENLAITEGLPMPKVYIMNDPGMNAFATGRDPNHASVAITSGLLDALDDVELQGVMAHELGHVKNYDIRVSMVAFGLVMVISLLADIFLRISFFGGRRRSNENDSAGSIMMIIGLVAIVLSPIVASLIQAAISRKREYLADATGAMTTRYPEGLARALEKIKIGGSATLKQNTSTAHLFFANPLSKSTISNLFSTHPPIDDRIEKLRLMGGKM